MRKGSKHSKETKAKMEKAWTARTFHLVHSESTKQKIALSKIGKLNPTKRKEVALKISESLTGRKIPLKTREKMSISKMGDANYLWKGQDVGYRALHTWVQNKLGKPNTCEHCKVKNLSGHKIHWANISKKYLRDVTDWVRLCVSCHKLFDKKVSQ